jgi:hypothetical protein
MRRFFLSSKGDIGSNGFQDYSTDEISGKIDAWTLDKKGR